MSLLHVHSWDRQSLLARQLSKRQVDCEGDNAISPLCNAKETASYREAFYVGSRDLTTERGTGTVDQIYIEKLTPSGGVM